ncbi:MAG: xanthine dehydrogenase family protein [Chloroflexi bacterium]|nr:xanthine dehydrogenase family protein [Chloroflexota bacterium]
MSIGESIPMLDSIARVTGAVEYVVNLKLPQMLVGKIIRASVSHARVLNVDATRAENIAGVRAILTRADALPMYGIAIPDQSVVANARVRFVGDPVAAIAAEDWDVAEDAASRVEIAYEELPAVFDAHDAMQAGAPILHEKFSNNIFRHGKLRHGDIEKGFADADEIFENTFTSPAAQQASLEPHASIAQWDGNKLTVWTGAQAPFAVRRALAQIFGIAEENVRVIVPPLGGGYGGKGQVRVEPIAAALARKTNGRPVKIVLSRAEEFVTVTKHAATLVYKTGVKRDGTFTARQIEIIWNGGAYADVSPNLVQAAVARAVGPYRIENVWVDSIGVYTNLPPAGAYRGAMSSQTTWAYESQMDLIARRMGWDAFDFRMKNILRDGDTFATGEKMRDVHFAECLEKVTQDFRVRRDAPPGRLYGRGFAVMMKSTTPASKSLARLKFSADGTLTVYTSTVELGQGAHTAMAQIAASAMQLPMRALRVIGPDTAHTPFDSTTSASRSTNMMGNAIIAAAENLKSKLRALAAPILETDVNELRVEGGKIFSKSESISFTEILQRQAIESIDALGEFETKLGLDPETGQGIATPHWHQGAAAVQIEVNMETGQINIVRCVGAAWAGRVVNPNLAQLQNDGNVIFALGPALMEEIIFDNGQVYNPNLSDYSIPSFRDIPREIATAALEGADGEMHGIGEMILPCVAPAIANALEDAVGVRITDLPLTPERVLRAIKNKE